MARRLRLQLAGGHYHLVCRGNRGQGIFSDDFDRQSFLDSLGECCGRTGWNVHGFCLLPDHVHLLVETPMPNLVVGMKWLCGTYTVRFNKRHRQHGHLFQGRYQSSHVSPRGGFLAVAADYIHLNPARAQLVPVDEPLGRYAWSSLKWYVQRQGRPHWITTTSVLADCGKLADTPRGRASYEQHVESVRYLDGNPAFERLRRGWCFGDEQFRKGLLGEVEREVDGRREHYGLEIHEAAESKANRVIEKELAGMRATAEELPAWRKGDSRKIRIARKLRAETTMTLAWIANRLHMGARTHLVHLLYWEKRRKGTQVKTPRRKRAHRSPNESLLSTDPSEVISFQQLDPRCD